MVPKPWKPTSSPRGGISNTSSTDSRLGSNKHSCWGQLARASQREDSALVQRFFGCLPEPSLHPLHTHQHSLQLPMAKHTRVDAASSAPRRASFRRLPATVFFDGVRGLRRVDIDHLHEFTSVQSHYSRPRKTESPLGAAIFCPTGNHNNFAGHLLFTYFEDMQDKGNSCGNSLARHIARRFACLRRSPDKPAYTINRTFFTIFVRKYIA